MINSYNPKIILNGIKVVNYNIFQLFQLLIKYNFFFKKVNDKYIQFENGKFHILLHFNSFINFVKRF